MVRGSWRRVPVSWLLVPDLTCRVPGACRQQAGRRAEARGREAPPAQGTGASEEVHLQGGSWQEEARSVPRPHASSPPWVPPRGSASRPRQQPRPLPRLWGGRLAHRMGSPRRHEGGPESLRTCPAQQASRGGGPLPSCVEVEPAVLLAAGEGSLQPPLGRDQRPETCSSA